MPNDLKLHLIDNYKLHGLIDLIINKAKGEKKLKEIEPAILKIYSSYVLLHMILTNGDKLIKSNQPTDQCQMSPLSQDGQEYALWLYHRKQELKEIEGYKSILLVGLREKLHQLTQDENSTLADLAYKILLALAEDEPFNEKTEQTNFLTSDGWYINPECLYLAYPHINPHTGKPLTARDQKRLDEFKSKPSIDMPLFNKTGAEKKNISSNSILLHSFQHKPPISVGVADDTSNEDERLHKDNQKPLSARSSESKGPAIYNLFSKFFFWSQPRTDSPTKEEQTLEFSIAEINLDKQSSQISSNFGQDDSDLDDEAFFAAIKLNSN